ncbi:thioredoxin family protein [Natribaculum luteum]|uniref:Thioredoxin family protein n=1 Tax=Natribaculum luteum TaxID=1586232 RepID=A0ABD5NX38_9EURY
MTDDTNATTDTPDRPVSLADEDDLDDLVSSHPLVLVEFYTEGCGICQSMEPVLGGVARSTDAVVGTVNPRDDPPLVDRFDVRSVPLLVLFADGDPVARRADGFVGAEELREWVDAERNR